MKTFRILFCITAIALMLFACSKDDNNETIPEKENTENVDDLVVLDNLSDDIKDMITNNENLTYKDIQDRIKDNKDIESSEVEDDVMCIYMKNGLQLQVDLEGNSLLADNEESEYDDVDIDKLVDEISEALEINEDEEEVYNSPARINSSVESANAKHTPMNAPNNSKTRILQRNNVLIWAPWEGHDNNLNNFHSALTQAMNGFQAKLGINEYTYKSDRMLSSNMHPKIDDLNSFSNYGLVILICHGTPKGQLAIPKTAYWAGLFNQSIKEHIKNQKIGDKATYRLDNGLVGEFICKKGSKPDTKTEVCEGLLLEPKFPDLSNTILWTCMCYAAAPGSVIQAAASKSNVADFMGANNVVTGTVAFSAMQVWAAQFFNKGLGGASSDDAFNNIANSSFKSIKISAGANNCFFYKDRDKSGAFLQKSKGYLLAYKLTPIPKQSKTDRYPVANVYTPASMNPNNGRRVKALAQEASTSQISAGFYITNKNTGQSQLVPFSENDKVKSATNGIITRLLITGNTDNLEEGEYKYKTYLKIGSDISYSEQEYTFKVNRSLCPDNNHPHAIDLGIGTKWACCNVGANSPEAYGGYYAWGETSEKSVYTDETYKYFDNAAYQNGKNWADRFQSLGSDIAGTSYDVAHVKWGGKWKMPSLDQIDSLLDKCTWHWEQLNGVSGQMVTGPNGNSVFLPATGDRCNDTTYYVGRYGYYWSSTQGPYFSYRAYSFYFDSSNAYVDGGNVRSGGRTVRPVTE